MTAQTTPETCTTQPVTAPIPVAGTRTEHPEAQGYLRQLAIGDFELESGITLPQVTIGYETWGTLNETGDNAIPVSYTHLDVYKRQAGAPAPAGE